MRLDLSWFAGLAVLVALSRELWAPEVAGPAALGLFLWRAAAEGERSAARIAWPARW